MLKRIFKLNPAGLIVSLLSGAVIALHLILRGNRQLMKKLSENVVKPIRLAQIGFTSGFRFSLAELLIAAAVLGITAYLICSVVRIARGEKKLQRAGRVLITLAACGLFVYAGFCFLWGTYYYGDDFITQSGLENRKISTAQLEDVTRRFAELAGEYSRIVERDENGVYCADKKAILARSPEVYRKVETQFPCLKGPSAPAKGIVCSKVMSLIDFTGFYFPFTGEANVNIDCPANELPSTVAHELAHLRGVAKEQEANFAAVLASLEYGDADYVYSAALLAYTHLGNALHSADYSAWEKIWTELDGNVKKDFAVNNEYWAKYKTPVKTISNSVYEGFLFSYSQDMGLKSYGACVDLLVNYYYGRPLME